METWWKRSVLGRGNSFCKFKEARERSLLNENCLFFFCLRFGQGAWLATEESGELSRGQMACKLCRGVYSLSYVWSLSCGCHGKVLRREVTGSGLCFRNSLKRQGVVTRGERGREEGERGD